MRDRDEVVCVVSERNELVGPVGAAALQDGELGMLIGARAAPSSLRQRPLVAQELVKAVVLVVGCVPGLRVEGRRPAVWVGSEEEDEEEEESG